MGDIIVDQFRKLGSIFQNKTDANLKKTIPFGEVLHTSSNFNVLPKVSFMKLYNYYLADPNVQNSVNTFSDQLVGIGYYITGNDKELINEINTWFRKIKFKRKFKTFVKDACITGNGMFEKLIQGKKTIDFDLVDMRIVTRIEPDKTDLRTPKQVIQTINGQDNAIPYENIIHYKMFDVSKQFFGIGLFHSLAVPQYEQDGEIRSIIDDAKRMRESFARIISRYASPKTAYTFPNENEAVIKSRAQEIKSMKEGETFVVNQDFGYKELTLNPQSRFDRYIDFIQLWYELGTQTPAAKLMTTPGFTEASARAALDIVEGRISSIQQDLEDMIEDEIIMPFLVQLEVNEKRIMDANINFHLGQPDIPDYNITDILQAATINVQNKPVITWKEVRELLRRAEWKLLSDEEVIKETEIEKQKEQPPPSTPSVQLADTKHKKKAKKYMVKKGSKVYEIEEREHE